MREGQEQPTSEAIQKREIPFESSYKLDPEALEGRDIINQAEIDLKRFEAQDTDATQLPEGSESTLPDSAIIVDGVKRQPEIPPQPMKEYLPPKDSSK